MSETNQTEYEIAEAARLLISQEVAAQLEAFRIVAQSVTDQICLALKKFSEEERAAVNLEYQKFGNHVLTTKAFIDQCGQQAVEQVQDKLKEIIRNLMQEENQNGKVR